MTTTTLHIETTCAEARCGHTVCKRSMNWKAHPYRISQVVFFGAHTPQEYYR